MIDADRAARAYLDTLTLAWNAVPEGRVETGAGGVRRFLSGTTIPPLNGIFTDSRTPDAAEVARLAAGMPGAGVPWGIQVRGEPSPEILAVADGFGRGVRLTEPLLACDAGRIRWRSGTGPAGARRITGADLELYADVLTTGYGAPREEFGALISQPALDTPAKVIIVLERDGVAVSTALGILAGDAVGVFSVTTPPRWRGRGYARLATEAVLRHAFAAGASFAFLASSEQALPLYGAMGFEVLESWTYLIG